MQLSVYVLQPFRLASRPLASQSINDFIRSIKHNSLPIKVCSDKVYMSKMCQAHKSTHGALEQINTNKWQNRLHKHADSRPKINVIKHIRLRETPEKFSTRKPS